MGWIWKYDLWYIALYFSAYYLGRFHCLHLRKKSFFGIDPLCNRRNSVFSTDRLLNSSSVFSVMQIFVSSIFFSLLILLLCSALLFSLTYGWSETDDSGFGELGWFLSAFVAYVKSSMEAKNYECIFLWLIVLGNKEKCCWATLEW